MTDLPAGADFALIYCDLGNRNWERDIELEKVCEGISHTTWIYISVQFSF